MKLLSDVEPEARVVVKRIEGGKDVTGHLKDLGITEGIELNVLAHVPAHEHRGAISARAAGKDIALGHGMAEKIYLERAGAMTTLLELEEGGKGVVKALGGGKDFAAWISELGIKEGSEIEFLRHLPDRTILFRIADREIKMGEGLASKVLAEYEGRSVQINFLSQGKKAKVTRIIGGATVKQRLDEMGFKEGADVTLTGSEPAAPTPQRGKYVRAKLGEQLITIGHGIAEKVWVE
ncbi:MAG TPA: ferrous iron transport protein A [Proteobacteria bacterium]|nr:ferrous iron transport protein A [Pseudomonadota bacterium]